MGTDTGVNSLEVRSVMANDFRQYKCIAENPGETCTDTFELVGMYLLSEKVIVEGHLIL